MADHCRSFFLSLVALYVVAIVGIRARRERFMRSVGGFCSVFLVWNKFKKKNTTPPTSQCCYRGTAQLSKQVFFLVLLWFLIDRSKKIYCHSWLMRWLPMRYALEVLLCWAWSDRVKLIFSLNSRYITIDKVDGRTVSVCVSSYIIFSCGKLVGSYGWVLWKS